MQLKGKRQIQEMFEKLCVKSFKLAQSMKKIFFLEHTRELRIIILRRRKQKRSVKQSASLKVQSMVKPQHLGVYLFIILG
jgi:hypothetical protein